LAIDAVTSTHASSAAVDRAIQCNEKYMNDIQRELRGLWLKSGWAAAGGAAAVISAAFILFKLFSGRI
jgi:hypothetical protein